MFLKKTTNKLTKKIIMEQEKPNWVDSLKKHLNSLSKEEIKEIREKYFKDDRPKGWLSIEQHLPMMFAVDIRQGYSVFKVRDKDGNEFETKVADHNTWYYHAKDIGITEWFNQ